jgi:hypothetical protein
MVGMFVAAALFRASAVAEPIASAGPPVAVSVSPNSGSGASVTFTAVYSDPNGATDLKEALLLINTGPSTVDGCEVYYEPVGNYLYLANNAGTWITPALTPGATGMASNSQCTLNAASTSVSTSGNYLTLTASLTFASAVVGPRNVYLYAIENGGQTTGSWALEGTWTPNASAGPPTIVSVSPATGTGTAATFTAVYSDPNGFGDLSQVQLLVNLTENGADACYVYYEPQTNQLFLRNDAGTAWLTPALTPGGTGTVGGSQCTLNAASSAVSTAGNQMTLKVGLTFSSTFVNSRNVYLYADGLDGQNSGWVKEGTWTPNPSAGPPAIVSLSPNSGDVISGTFTAVYSDPNGAADLSVAYLLANTSTAAASGCDVYYEPQTNQLYLANNAGTWITPALTPGVAGTASNSQCTLNAGSSSVNTAGNKLTLNVALSFSSTFVGSRNLYMYASGLSGQSSGWVKEGSLTLSASSVPALVHSTASENSQGNVGTGGNTTVYIANIDPVISGNCLGVAFGWSTYYSQPSGFAPTDDKGDKFYQVAENPDDTTNYYKMQVWMTPPITSGARYVSIPFGVQTTEVQAIVFEVTNCGATSAAIVDGHSSNTGSGTAVTAGSLTPGTSGDLLLQFAVVDTASCSGSQCKRTIPAATGVSAFSQSNITWALRHAELLDGTLMQDGVYSSATAINPEMTLASSESWISIAIAIKGASGGGTPTGPNISSIQHVSMWSTAQGGPGYANPSVTQFPSACAENCTVVVAVNGGCDISSISYGGTPLNKRLTYTSPGASETEQFFDLVGYTPNNAYTFSIAPDLGCTSVNGYDWTWTLVFYDFAGSYTYSFDKVTSPGASGYAVGTCLLATCDTVGPSITPATSSGILLTETSEWYNQVLGVSSPWLLDVIYDSILYQSPALDEQNGWAHYYNTSTSSETPTWNYMSSTQVVGFWATASISYSATENP